MEENEKQGGFWKGFFCALLLVCLIAGAGKIGALLLEQKAMGNTVSRTKYVTQDQKVRAKLGKLEKYIRNNYLNDIDEKEMEDYLYYGLVASLGDPYAAYFNEEEMQGLIDSSNGSYCGIGAVFSQNMVTGEITVSQVYEGCPSYEAGILPGDILYKVEGEDITGEDLNNIVTKIKGEEGTEVTVTMLREEEEIDFTMERRTVEVPTISHEMLADQVGYIKITEFDKITADQFHAALEALKIQGMKALVIDLRNNGGGNVDTVCSIADELLPEGPIVYTEYKGKEREEERSDAACLELPMCVLINERSASASEILAGALQDYGVAKIVGTQSFGKGIVQSVIDLKDGTALKITTARYYTPNGNNIHEIGITPDVEIDLPEEVKNQVEISYEEDVQLQKAIEVLQQ